MQIAGGFVGGSYAVGGFVVGVCLHERVARWCSGIGVRLVIERSRVRLDPGRCTTG